MSCTEKLYIENATTLEDRVNRYGQIIDALELQILQVAAGNSDIEEYSLDDGQIKIKTIYRSIDSMQKGIAVMERSRQRLINQLNGRQMVLRPWEGLRK